MTNAFRNTGPGVPAGAKAGACAGLGVLLLIAGAIDHSVAAQKAAICNSGLGQLGQAFDQSAARGCTLYTGMEGLTGWLVAGGVLALLAAVVLVASVQSKPAGSADGTDKPAGGTSY